MAGEDLVRPSRDGDQFHYLWAARQCLRLLPGASDLVAVTIEGPSTSEGRNLATGEELIDVGFYFASEARTTARQVRYVQLKHSTRQSDQPWTASGLKKTVEGFAKRYAKLVQEFPPEDVAQRFRFEFTTNRPIDEKVRRALADLAAGATPRDKRPYATLMGYCGLPAAAAQKFFSLFSAEGGEEGLWAQRNLLAQDLSAYLPDADYDAPVQLKELVTRKATTEFETNPSIRRQDVLRAMKASEDQLQPSPCLIADPSNSLAREQEGALLEALLNATAPVVLHAEGGVGKSVLAARLARAMPFGSEAVLYDCFGDGLYRNALHFRHRHRDALVQIANELAARGLCDVLVPSAHADVKAYMRAFVHRLKQAVSLLRARHASASLCLVIDAADNAEMAAEEQGEPASFVRDLIRTELPEGVRLAFTCRTHRRARLSAPPAAIEIELLPFSEAESARHLRATYPEASDAEVAEFNVLSSSNPRVQALALSRGLPLDEMLKQLGPTPTTVDKAIGELLEAAVARLKDQEGAVGRRQIDGICQALSVLRPLMPVSVIAKLSGSAESAVRTFALDFGRPLFLKGDSLHFMDEPAETWFREHFQPDAQGMADFLERLRPLAAQSSYAAAIFPQLLLQAGKLDELVVLALSNDGLPTDSPLAKRDVELQRLTFALKACLQRGQHVAAAKLALKAAGECAGEDRQNTLIQSNTDLAAALLTSDRIEEIVSRRTFGSGWMGSHHAYDAGLLSGRPELSAEASSRLRMAMDWLWNWAGLPAKQRDAESVDDDDRAELTLALLRLRGPKAAAKFLRGWRSRHCSFEAGARTARRLVDIGDGASLDALSLAARNDLWLLLGLAREARRGNHLLPAPALKRLLRLLGHRCVLLKESGSWDENWNILYAICSTIEMALQVLPPEHGRWASLLKRYLPKSPPNDLSSRFGFDRGPMLRAYALEAALSGRELAATDVAPTQVRDELARSGQYGRGQDTEVFLQEVGGLLPVITLSAEAACGRLPAEPGSALEAAFKAASSSRHHVYRQGNSLLQAVVRQGFQFLCDNNGASGAPRSAFDGLLAGLKEPLWPDTYIALSRAAARAGGFEDLALKFATLAFQALERSRDDAETRASSYVALSRAILGVSPSEAGAYFDRAVEIASRIGEENLDRWAALLNLGNAAGDRTCARPRTAYRLSRVAELTYEFVARDKHFDWDRTVNVLTDLCPTSCFAILGRWRDRRFGDPGRLLPKAVYRLLNQGHLSAMAPIVFAPVEGRWERVNDLKRALEAESDSTRRSKIADAAYRYVRVETYPEETWAALAELGKTYGLELADVDRLRAHHRVPPAPTSNETDERTGYRSEHRGPNWDAIFAGVDLTDTKALREAYADLRTYDPPYEFEAFFREAFARVGVGKHPEVIRAVAAWPDFDMLELRSLMDGLPKPLPPQIALRGAVRDAVLAACRREPHRVIRQRWRALIPFHDLYDAGVVTDADVVKAALEGFAAQVDSLGAGSLFQLVDPLSSCLRPHEADEALNFGLDLLDDLLRPEDGDGAWRTELEPPSDLNSALAGYIWAGLGSAIAAERWQFAHVVRSAVELDWTEVIQALLARAESGTAEPFVDTGLQFYSWHAWQWFLVGLARGGLENPLALVPAKDFLLRSLTEKHVLIRALAADSLRCLETGGVTEIEAGLLEDVNSSPFPEDSYRSWRPPTNTGVSLSDDEPPSDEKYYFGMDIGRYWFQHLGSAFDLTEAVVERYAFEALRTHMGWKAGAPQQDARFARSIFRDGEAYHSHGSLPKTDDTRAYLGYHSMMIVAARLLEERRVGREAEARRNDFEEWLSDYLLTRADGRWLADRHDPRLVEEPPPNTGYGDTVWPWTVTRDYVNKQLIADDGLIVCWGHWTGGDDNRSETVSVRSALVSRKDAESLIAALQTAPELGRFSLPSADQEDDDEHGLGASKQRQGWVSERAMSARMDEYDPWADGVRFPGPAPAPFIATKLLLAGSADQRRWTSTTGAELGSETWTQVRGYGREATTESGYRLRANRTFVQELYAAEPNSCLVLSVEIRRYPPRHSRGSEEFEPYPWPYALYYLMEADGVARAL